MPLKFSLGFVSSGRRAIIVPMPMNRRSENSDGIQGSFRQTKKDPYHVRCMIKVSQIKMHTDSDAVVLTSALQYVLLATPFYA